MSQIERPVREESPIVTSPDGAAAALKACLSPSSFWWPQQLGPQSAWFEHAPFAFWLVEALRPRLLVELGTYAGYSCFSFCQAVQQLRLETRRHTVDTWKGDEHGGFYGEEVYAQVRARQERLYASFSTLMRLTFDEALPRCADASIDLLHIDGRHRYEDVKHEFQAWAPKLSDRSIVLFHDINVHERDFGGAAFWREVSSAHPHLEFVHGHGLGVLGFGGDQPDRIRLLFNAGDREGAARVCDAYARLGSAISLRWQTDLQRAELAEQAAILTSARERAEQLESMLQKHSAEIDTERTRAAHREDERDSARQLLAHAERNLAARPEEVFHLRDELAAAEAHVSSLEFTMSEFWGSTSWRRTAPLRWNGRIVRSSKVPRGTQRESCGSAVMRLSPPSRSSRAPRSIAKKTRRKKPMMCERQRRRARRDRRQDPPARVRPGAQGVSAGTECGLITQNCDPPTR